MSFAATMSPAASISFGDEQDYVEPVYNLSSVDPLALIIWWKTDKVTWDANSYPPNNNTVVTRLQTIGSEGADSVEKLLPGMVYGLPDEMRVEAQRTREYYINKFVQMGIKHEQPISPVRRAMYQVLTDTSNLATKELALMTRIHDFYVEDQFTDQLVENAVSVDADNWSVAHYTNQVYTVIGNNRRITVRSKTNTWWMQGDDRTLLMLSAPTNVTTNGLVNQMLQPGRRWHVRCDSCGVRSVKGHMDFNTRVLTHGYTLDEAPDSA